MSRIARSAVKRWGGGVIGATLGVALLLPSAAGAASLHGVAGATSSAVAVGDGVIWWASTIHQTWFAAEGVDSTLSYLACARVGSGYLAAASNGSIWSSADGDGRSFLRRSRPATAALRSLAVVGSRLVAVGDGGIIYLSGDLTGASWTPESSPATATLRGVAWSGTSTRSPGRIGMSSGTR